MAKEFFVNNAWINSKKVPRETACGVDLKYKENAFQTLGEALAKGGVNAIYHDYEDWIKFTCDGGDYAVCLDDNSRHADMAVEIWKAGNYVDTIEWSGSRFDIGSGLMAGTEYQLRMVMHPTTTSDDSGLAYTFGKLA